LPVNRAKVSATKANRFAPTQAIVSMSAATSPGCIPKLDHLLPGCCLRHVDVPDLVADHSGDRGHHVADAEQFWAGHVIGLTLVSGFGQDDGGDSRDVTRTDRG
jgi:hypothetical protein